MAFSKEEQEQARQTAEEQKEYTSLLASLNYLMKIPAGREVMWFILAQCGIYDNTFSGDNNTFFLMGKRDVGLCILGLMEDADPTLYAKLQLEHANG